MAMRSFFWDINIVLPLLAHRFVRLLDCHPQTKVNNYLNSGLKHNLEGSLRLTNAGEELLQGTTKLQEAHSSAASYQSGGFSDLQPMEFHKSDDYSQDEHSPRHENFQPLKGNPRPEFKEQNADTRFEMYAPTPTTLANQFMAKVSIESFKCTSQLENGRPEALSEASVNLPHERQSSHSNSHSKSDSLGMSMGSYIYAPIPRQCNLSFVRQGLEIVETIERITAANGLCPKQANKPAGGKAVNILGDEMLQTTERMIENAPTYSSASESLRNALVEENLSLVVGKIMGTQSGGILDSASHPGSKSAVLENCSLNRVSEVLNQTGIGKTLGTVSEVIAVTKAVKDGDVSAILEDEHVQELGRKAFGIGLEMATSAILTASGAGAVMAVASATSDVIAAVKEVKDMEDNGGHGVAGFVLESGAKIALKAAMKGSGAEAALSVAAPILEPLCQKAVDGVAQRGADLIDRAATNAGAKSILKDGIDAMVSAEDTVASVLQLKTPIVEEKLAGTILQTGKTVFQQVAGTVGSITGSSDRIESQIVKRQEHSIIPAMDEALLRVVSACAESHTFDGATNITSPNLFGDLTMTTLVSGTINAVNARLTGRFEPIRAGMELLEVLCCISKSKGLCMINGLSVAAITRTHELTKSKVSSDAKKYQTLFDPDGDGIVRYSDTVRALALLGLTGFVARLAAYNFHVMFSYPTSDGLLPRFDLSLPIQVKNMSRTVQGRNWGTLERAKFIIDRFFRDGGGNSKVWLTGPRGFQTLLFLFEWGTMWPFQSTPFDSEPDSKPEEIGLVFTKAIIPLILNHWALFQNTKSEGGFRSH